MGVVERVPGADCGRPRGRLRDLNSSLTARYLASPVELGRVVTKWASLAVIHLVPPVELGSVAAKREVCSCVSYVV